MLISEQIARIVGGKASGRELPGPTLAVAPVTVASVFKRVMDVVGAGLGLVLLAPLMLAVALVVRLSSPGPILFRQLRLGRGGRPFYVLKFRTMIADAEHRLAELEARNEAAGGVLFKIRRDPRVTPLGAFLRRSSLDELPQLINVLRGDMSLVGPRPLQLRDSYRLEALDPDAFARRLSVMPGITGAWQVGGRSDGTEGMVRQDIEYITNWSLALDLKILLQTIPAVLSARGAC
ncbi:sugar transferase [Tautonia sociabilis]|uniref:Sugar transferase n=2 Tax=Tautonia sociabilis TaxID=2080755 RepID=A0A432MFS6_9BACT|nr:sugar transferase [Tautonia sociabilis]